MVTGQERTRLSHAPLGQSAVQVHAQDGKLLAVYHWDKEHRQPFFHPLYSYRGSEPLTCFAPWDHPWHKGLWWSWKYINRINFWEHLAREGEGEGQSIVTDHDISARPDGSICIQQKLKMRSIATQETYLLEDRRITIAPSLPELPDSWYLDWEATTTALLDCELSVTPYSEALWGGYAGLNFRPNRSMGWGETIRNSEGLEGHPACHGQRARWAAYCGRLDGDETATPTSPSQAGLAILDHPRNPSYPTPFYAWSTGDDNRSFGFLAAAPLMHIGRLALSSGDRLQFRYRVILFDEPIRSDKLSEAWESFAATETQTVAAGFTWAAD